jgi:hypothetical protein
MIEQITKPYWIGLERDVDSWCATAAAGLTATLARYGFVESIH